MKKITYDHGGVSMPPSGYTRSFSGERIFRALGQASKKQSSPKFRRIVNGS